MFDTSLEIGVCRFFEALHFSNEKFWNALVDHKFEWFFHLILVVKALAAWNSLFTLMLTRVYSTTTTTTT